MSVLATGDVTLAATASVVTGGTGTLEVAATTGRVTMAAAARLQTGGGNLRVAAGQSVTLGLVDARTAVDRAGNTLANQAAWGQVSVTAGAGAVLDASPAGDTTVNIYAATVRFTATTGVGSPTPDNAIETEVVNASALASAGSINLRDATALAVVVAGLVPANRVQADGTVVTTQDATAQGGVTHGTGGTSVVQAGNDTPVSDLPAFSVVTTLTTGSQPNFLTGLYEQTVRISNPLGNTIEAVRVRVRNLPAGTSLYNAVGVVNGEAFVLYNQPLLAGQSVDLVLEYFVPTRMDLPTAPNLLPESVPPSAPLNPVGTLIGGVQTNRLADGRYLVQFESLASRTYYVQYSSDQLTWKTAMPPLTGTGSRLFWLDSGPPKTDTAPGTDPLRYYRVLLVP